VVASTDRQLHPAVVETLAALGLEAKDQAAAKLAETYARAIDGAKSVEASADAILRRARSESEGEDDPLIEQVQALRNKMRAQVALENLGPKLAAILVELQATPKARAAGSPGAPVKGKKLGALSAFREGRLVADG